MSDTTSGCFLTGLNGVMLPLGNMSPEQKVFTDGQMDGQEIFKPTLQDKPPSDCTNSGPGESIEERIYVSKN